MRIHSDALFRNTTFNGPVRFQGMTVGGSFETGNNVKAAHFNERRILPMLPPTPLDFQELSFLVESTSEA